MTFRAHLKRARCLSNRDVGEASSLSSSSVGPDDSASAQCSVDPVVEGAVMMNGASLDAVMTGYSAFMIAALARAEPAAVASIVDTYSTVVAGCLTAGIVSSSREPVSVVGSGSGVSVRPASWVSRRSSDGCCSSSKVVVASKSISPVLNVGSSESGLCYMKFVAKGCRTAAKRCLGEWPSVGALLRSPAELYDMGALESHKLTQVSADVWHVEGLGNWSVQLSARYAFALAAETSAPSDKACFSEGTLGSRLLSVGSAGGAARVVPLGHKIGGDVELQYRVVDPPADWTWSKQFKWCDANSHCRLYWRYGSCGRGVCSSSHFRVSVVRLRAPGLPESRWTKSQKVKWCKYNSFCWRKFSAGVCEDLGCTYSHALSDDLLGRAAGSVAVPVARVVSVESSSKDEKRNGVMDVSDALVKRMSFLGVPGLGRVPSDVISFDAFRNQSSGSFAYSPHLITDFMAVDCEMMTADRVLSQGRSILGRVSIVNCFGQLVYDAFVYPEDCGVANTNYRWGSGITRSDILPTRGAVPFSSARAVVLDCFSSATMVGFALHNDLKVLRLSPGMIPGGVIDVQSRRVFSASGRKSLKFLAALHLHRQIQVGVSHSSIEDAVATMQLFIFSLGTSSLRRSGARILYPSAAYVEEHQRDVSRGGDVFDGVSSEFMALYAPNLSHVMGILDSS